MCSILTEKTIIVINYTFQAEGLGWFFKVLARATAKAGTQLVEQAGKMFCRVIAFPADTKPATAVRSPKTIPATGPAVIKFIPQAKDYV